MIEEIIPTNCIKNHNCVMFWNYDLWKIPVQPFSITAESHLGSARKRKVASGHWYLPCIKVTEYSYLSNVF